MLLLTWPISVCRSYATAVSFSCFGTQQASLVRKPSMETSVGNADARRRIQLGSHMFRFTLSAKQAGALGTRFWELRAARRMDTQRFSNAQETCISTTQNAYQTSPLSLALIDHAVPRAKISSPHTLRDQKNTMESFLTHTPLSAQLRKVRVRAAKRGRRFPLASGDTFRKTGAMATFQDRSSWSNRWHLTLQVNQRRLRHLQSPVPRLRNPKREDR